MTCSFGTFDKLISEHVAVRTSTQTGGDNDYFLHCIIFLNSSPGTLRCKNNSYSIYASLYLSCFAILAWSLTRLRLEKADKVLRILKAEVLADLRNAEGFIYKQLSGSGKQSVVD